MPPYPAPAIYLTGWMDACITELWWYIQYLTTWGARHEAIDTFFDTYFFKNANNVRHASGGRLSNNSAGGSVNTFRGISGRAFSILARYGVQPNASTFINLKTYLPTEQPFILGIIRFTPGLPIIYNQHILSAQDWLIIGVLS